MSLIWRKIWRDMALNKGRTLLAVLSIAVGIFALGLIFGAYDVICRCLEEKHWSIVPVHVTLWGQFDHEAEQAVMHEPGIAETERQADQYIMWKLEGETSWRDGTLIAREDYQAQRIELISLLDGHWPEKRTLAIERQSSRHFDRPIGTSIIVKFDGGERTLPLEGIVHDYTRTPPQSGGNATFYATQETVAWLVGSDFNRLDVRLANHAGPGAEEVAERAWDRLERLGYWRGGTWIREPDEHWFQASVDTMLIILGALGAMSLGMSTFLVINTMNAIITQQVWQIGVIKTLGATFWRVVRIYLTIALVYGGLALLIALPLGALCAHLLAVWVLDNHANIVSVPFQLTPTALGIQIAVGLIVPPLAGLVPVVGGARISPHSAISTYGLGGRFGRGLLDRALGRIRFLPRPMALSLRNTFRAKARLSLTLIMLALGGAMFMMVMNVTGSFLNTVEILINNFGDDVRAGFDRPYPLERLIEVAESVPGVTKVEVWGRWGTRLKLANGEDRYMSLRAPPPDSGFFNPNVVTGRELLPGDDHAILLNHKIAIDEGIRVGDSVRFDFYDRETVWKVVGLILLPDQYECFVPFEALAAETGEHNRGTRIHLSSEKHDLESQKRVTEALRAAYTNHHIEMTWAWSTAEMREDQWRQYQTIHYLLLVMALLAGLVGGIGLMGTMSINVVERSREIGVMRATGGTALAIVGIFVGEGVLLGVLSWLLAVPLSYPAARLVSDMIGQELMYFPLVFTVSIQGMALWLLIAMAISALASLWPAWRATQISVREALAYE